MVRVAKKEKNCLDIANMTLGISILALLKATIK